MPDDLPPTRPRLTPVPGGSDGPSGPSQGPPDPDRTAEAAPPNSLPESQTRPGDPSRPPREPAARTGVVPGYETLGVLGRGGMGVVYKARDTRLDRIVALKMIIGDVAPDRQSVIRFLAEAQAAAAVRHPGVVQLLDYGEADGRPYMALEFCPGGTLGERLKGGRRLEAREAAALVAAIAEGVAAAHEAGIVHRDLKPGNVLFDADGRPKVTDFGLAKRATGADLTRTGAVMGTPQYMAPEQAGGKAKYVGPPADVWALGVILYQALTGQKPFDAESTDSLLARVLLDDPVSVRSLVPGLSRDVDLICRKCLDKNPADRYPTARELAEDLRRFASGEPISVRSAGTAERLYKWARRKPTLAAAYGSSIAALVLAAITGGAVVLWRTAEDERRSAEGARHDAEQAQSAAETERGNALVAKGVAEEARGRAEQAGRDLRTANANLDDARRQIAFLNYAHLVRLAHSEYQMNDLANARARLAQCPDDLRHWEWRYVNRLCHLDRLTFAGHTDIVFSAEFSPDGTRVMSTGQDAAVRVWDPDTGAEAAVLRGYRATFSPDGTRVLTTLTYTPWVWDAKTGKQLAALKGHTSSVVSVAFSADGKRVVTASQDKTARVWDAETGKELTKFAGHTDLLVFAAFDPDGRRVVSTAHDKTARVWDAETGKELAVLRGHSGTVGRAVFTPDGRRVVTGGHDRTVRVWEVPSAKPEGVAATGKETGLYRGHLVGSDRATGAPLVVTTEGGAVRFVDAATGKERVTLKDAGTTSAFVLSRDGQRIAAASHAERTVRVWDVRSGKELAAFKGHTAPIRSLAFDPTGRRVVSASEDKTVRVWDPDTGREVTPISVKRTYVVEHAAFAPDGRMMTVASGGIVRLWDPTTGKELVAVNGHMSVHCPPAASRDGRLLATAVGKGLVRVWDATTGKPVADTTGHAIEVRAVVFSPDGRRLLTASGQTSKVWEATTGKEIAALTLRDARPKGGAGRPPEVTDAAFSADGRTVATAASDGIVRVWDAATGAERFRVTGEAYRVVFSADGRRLLTAGGAARLWDAASGAPVAKLDRPVNWRTVRFSPDGRRLVAAEEFEEVAPDGRLKKQTAFDPGATVWVWDAETGKELAALGGHTGWQVSLSFSPDGRRLATVSPDRPPRLWDVETGKELLQLVGGREVAFSPDGRLLLTFHPTDDNLVLVYTAEPRGTRAPAGKP